MKEKVLVAMSGGVDSSAAALLLLEQGYDVCGATFRLFDDAPEDAVADAAAVCRALGIGHMVLDYRAVFAREVMDYFTAAYESGKTPNPCVACNRAIKFGLFCEDAKRLGYTKISTGHYASVRYDESAGRFCLYKSRNLKKDQSYVLYHLSRQQLSMLLLPLEDCDKQALRERAAAAGLPVAHKAESQDICFVPDGDYVLFIARRTGREPVAGDYIDESGAVLGRHKGVLRYTIGQSRGLGIALGTRRFVSRLDPAANTVTLSDEAAVFSDTLRAADLCMMAGEMPAAPLRADVKIRYAHKGAPATVYPPQDGIVTIVFDEPQRAITPGQAAVFYRGSEVLGGATIL